MAKTKKAEPRKAVADKVIDDPAARAAAAIGVEREAQTQAMVPVSKGAIAAPAADTKDATSLDGLGPMAIVDGESTPYLSITEKAAAILQEPLRDDEVEILPTGEVYLSQIGYRRRLNGAFRPGSWRLKPLAEPAQMGKTLVQRWSLIVFGVEVAESIGEADYQERNDRMSWATAWESAKSNALMRLCKDLGVASECWDRRWTEAWKQRNAIQVFREKQEGRDNKPQWRRVDAEPWYDETGVVQGSPNADKFVKRSRGSSSSAPPANGVRPGPAAGGTKTQGKPPDDRVISEAQCKRLYTIAGARAEALDLPLDSVKAAVKIRLKELGYESSKEIKVRDYDAVVAWVEKFDPATMDADPGESEGLD
jgi:hypothetical protein